MLSILCFLWLEWHSVSYVKYEFPYWTSLLGWAISTVPLLFVPIIALAQICSARGSLAQRWATVLNPDDSWGPALAVHRAEQFPLQIPEARRLLIPPEVEVLGSHQAVCEDKNGGPLDSSCDRVRPLCSITSVKSKGATSTNAFATFERETAI
ncbi:hypothetical protein ANCDUO_10577 [Ancylostoma duodenale]|uniref:Sodium:neurotransmitter symporter family protein n=1 Tax=Ancylostoma duodenale TaxID=51022 RepID=A0A0C2GK14_9BILA|nr:hypothetical protein ANCDUO_10577 [Ancylostoma duodenale]